MQITEAMVVAVMNVARENMRSIGADETRQMLQAALDASGIDHENQVHPGQRQTIRAGTIFHANQALARVGLDIVLHDGEDRVLIERTRGQSVPPPETSGLDENTEWPVVGPIEVPDRGAIVGRRTYQFPPQADLSSAFRQAIVEANAALEMDGCDWTLGIHPQTGHVVAHEEPRTTGEIDTFPSADEAEREQIERYVDSILSNRFQHALEHHLDAIKDLIRQETQERLREWVPSLVNAELTEDRLRLGNLTQLVDVTRNAVRRLSRLPNTAEAALEIDRILDGER